MNRRKFLRGLLAAGMAVAVWEPTKLISIPSNKIYTGEMFRINSRRNISITELGKVQGPTVLQLHRWLQEQADNMCSKDSFLDILSPTPSLRITDEIVQLQNGYYVENPQYLTNGSLEQKDEIWAGLRTVGQIQEDSYVMINGEKAVRPGHVNQCVKVKVEGRNMISLTTKRAGYECNPFVIENVYKGINTGALLEQRQLLV